MRSWPVHLLAGLLLALLVGVRPAGAQEPAPPADEAALRVLVEAAGDADDNGGAHKVTVFRRTEVRVEESGLSHVENHEVVKCLSEQGAVELARIRLDYDPASNQIEVRQLRILRRDGTIEDLPPEGVDLPQPQWAIYWGARMKLLPVPRLRPGDALEIRTYMKGFLIAYLGETPAPATGPAAGASGDDERYVPPMRGHFYDVVYFQDRHPVKVRHYTVRTPRDKPLQYEVYNGEVQSYVAFDETHNIYTFWKQDLPAYEEEGRYAAEFPDVATKVVLATVPDWEAKSRWFCQVNEGQFEADPAIRAMVEEITRGLRTDEERISAINHWVADNIRYAGISMGQGEGYTLHPGSMVFRNRSGVCKDKAGMAITMLRAAGYTVYPAMTMAGARVERIPADQFNHCVVALQHDDGRWQMLDPTWVVFSPEEWSSAEGEQHYVIGTPEGETLMMTPSFRAEDNRIQVEARTSLDADGNLTGSLVISGAGYADQRLRRELVHTTATRDRQAWFEELVSHLGPGAEVETVDVDYEELQDVRTPIRYEVRFRVPNYAMLGDDGSMYFAPPTARHLLTSRRLAPYLEAALDAERTQALLIWAPRMRDVTEVLTLPPGYRVVRLPEDRTIDHDVASLHTHLEVNGRKVTYTQQVQVKQREIPAEAYPDFKEVVDETLALPGDLIVLKRRGQ